MMRAVPTRRELMDRAEARLRSRGGDEGSLEASRCFLRAMLVGVDETARVPDDLVSRVCEFLKIDKAEVVEHAPALRRQSTRPPSNFPLQAPPGERRRRVLLLGRADGARLAMFDAVARAMVGDDAEVRCAGLTPVAYDPRALRVLRHSGYPTELLNPRAVTVDDLSWADLVITVGGDREDWERFLPRSTPHQHEQVDDPVALTRGLSGDRDELDAYRAVLRVVERVIGQLRPPRSSRFPAAPPMPAAPPVRASWSRIPVRSDDEDPRSRR